MATRYHVPAGYMISASATLDVTGFIRSADDERQGSIVNRDRAISFGPYNVARDFIVTGDLTVTITPVDAQGAVVPDLDPYGTAAANGAVLAAAVVAANRVNGFVKLPGGRYPMACSLTTGCMIEWAPDTVLLQEQRASVLDVNLGASALGPHTISGWNYGKHTNNAGAGSAKFLRLTMSAEDAANYQVGDSIMVCSQDARTYYTGDTDYAGEMAFVAAVEAGSGYVYLDGTLYLYGVGTLLTTTPVAYRLSRETVRLIRPQVEANGDVYQTGLSGSLWPGSIQLTAAARPRLENLRVNSAWSAASYFKCCSMVNVTFDHIRDCPGDPAGARYGYGVLLRGACNAASISGGITERCRHAFTTDSREAASWLLANLWEHGVTTDATVRGITAVGGGGVQFDTHENSIATSFIDCTAVGSRYDPSRTSTTGVGFNLRGPWDSVYNCRAMDCEGGVGIDTTGIAHEIVGENVVDGLQFWGEATNGLAAYGIYIDGASGETTPQRVAIRNLRPGQGTRAIFVQEDFTGRISVDNCLFRGWADTQVRVQGSCTMDFVGNFFDMTESLASELIISVDNSNTVALNLINNAIRSRASSSTTVFVTTASGATSNIRHAGNYEVNASNLSGGISGGAGTNNETAITALA